MFNQTLLSVLSQHQLVYTKKLNIFFKEDAVPFACCWQEMQTELFNRIFVKCICVICDWVICDPTHIWPNVCHLGHMWKEYNFLNIKKVFVWKGTLSQRSKWYHGKMETMHWSVDTFWKFVKILFKNSDEYQKVKVRAIREPPIPRSNVQCNNCSIIIIMHCVLSGVPRGLGAVPRRRLCHHHVWGDRFYSFTRFF